MAIDMAQAGVITRIVADRAELHPPAPEAAAS
jgi:hypothetical protein